MLPHALDGIADHILCAQSWEHPAEPHSKTLKHSACGVERAYKGAVDPRTCTQQIIVTLTLKIKRVWSKKVVPLVH